MKKNKFLAVILAMAVAVGAAGVTTYAVGKGANDTEAPSTVVTAASDTEAVKDETVYVMTAADGSTQKILVSDWIKNALPAEAQKAIESLNDAQQVKDDCWTGTIQKELPVSMSIHYTLDGKTVTPSELAGKSGKVTIRFEYENNQYEVRTVNGVSQKVYVPFVALTGALLDTSHFSNVTVSNGKLINDGDRIAVMGMAFPGLKNPNYYRTAAHIDGFEVRCVSDASTQEIAFRNKELSIFTISNAETLANYKDNDEYQVVSYPDGRITFMEINPNSEAMSTMEARQAVIYALDLDALVYGTYGDEALCRTATSILSTVSMFYNPEITNYKQDLDKAAQLIEQTGLKDKTIKIIYNSARVGQEELATMIKSQLDAVGLNAQIDSMETAAYFKSYFYATDSYDIALMGNGMLDDPSGFVGLFAHTRSGANMYTTDEVDKLWVQLDREMDPAVRQDIMNQGLQALKDCWSCVPVLDTNYVCAAQKNIGGFEASDRLTDLTQIYFIG